MMWWLSFVDGNLPEGEQFLGATVVPGSCIATASISAHAMGSNPGVVGKLMSRDEAESFDASIEATLN